MRYFHFTLGPVQSFVAQARRTRDFWAGSFLLSYLAGVAMREVRAQAGNDAIVFPKPETSYLHWINGSLRQGKAPRHGGIPNRFLAKVPDNFKPSLVEKAVKTAWRQLAELVWKEDFGERFGDTETRKIWNRQIDGFWEISWAIVDKDTDTSILDRRKNWRSHYPQPEPGPKCMMMEGMQELSGAEKPGQGREFWDQLRWSKKPRIATDLRENERLCAVAYVKRRFVHYFQNFEADMPSGWKAHGWRLPRHVDSVVYLAARPWLDQVQELAKEKPALEEKLRTFYNAARVLSDESETTNESYDWKSVEELAFFEADLRNPRLFPDRERAERAINALTALQKADDLGPPAPYYALLLMDGDSLGKHMSDRNKRELISEALKRFTERVQEIVETEHQGLLIYAGGDDVLALLTVEAALPCAKELRNAYDAAFKNAFKGKEEDLHFPATISAAIEYAHYRLPFTKILADAHYLLDDVAKDGRGRDAVAARVWKQSGLHLTWAQPWEIALQDGGMLALVDALKTRDIQFAGGFFYRMRDLFELLNSPDEQAENRIGTDDMAKLLAHEYAHSGIHGNTLKPKDAETLIRPLLAQCQPMRRKADDPKSVKFEPDVPERYEADAALLVRFMVAHSSKTSPNTIGT
ncbi:type III-B CRISPR-associated protein Cas10/Cmr2 [Methylocaldum szegediense]|uniref:CRISPR-associated protein Cmr2 n=1 Tax=Methylocaldum szegediense TaxID=73780 RepID=A0ABN8XE60_9GAMM|nr:type III-B CRISPR-associated protein Cas10/Cmr2 [Methylocaldum szegediense]CAI8970223.1 CRISPR-associated protein Cmr2 [Methylocaldum szegediense]